MDLPIYAVTAAAALGLVGSRRESGRLARREYQLSVRPLLSEIPAEDHASLELVRFGPPRNNSVETRGSALYLAEDDALLQMSVPFRNVGSGPAVIRRVAVEPRGMGSVIASRAIVAVGGLVRVNASLAIVSPSHRTKLAVESFTMIIEYSDAAGSQQLVSRAHINRVGEGGSYVGPVDVLQHGEEEPFLTAGAIRSI